jgi:hypothetical protein
VFFPPSLCAEIALIYSKIRLKRRLQALYKIAIEPYYSEAMKCVLFFLLLLATSLAQAAEPPALKDGDYTLKVTHAAQHPVVQFPRSPIPDKEYKPANKESNIQLRFSEEGKKVILQPEGVPGKGVSGTLEKADADGRFYDLKEGLFAGCSLRLKQTKQGLIATYTIYGSGVPVIASFRGQVERADRQKQKQPE